MEPGRGCRSQQVDKHCGSCNEVNGFLIHIEAPLCSLLAIARTSISASFEEKCIIARLRLVCQFPSPGIITYSHYYLLWLFLFFKQFIYHSYVLRIFLFSYCVCPFSSVPQLVSSSLQYACSNLYDICTGSIIIIIIIIIIIAVCYENYTFRHGRLLHSELWNDYSSGLYGNQI